MVPAVGRAGELARERDRDGQARCPEPFGQKGDPHGRSTRPPVHMPRRITRYYGHSDEVGNARFKSWPWHVTDYTMYLNATIADPEARGTLSFNRTVYINADTMAAIAARADLVFVTLEALCQIADGATLDSTLSLPTIPELLRSLFPETSPTSGEEVSLPTSP